MTGKAVILSDHARRQAARRGIDDAAALGVAAAPEQVVPVRSGREIRQARNEEPGSRRQHLVRVVVDLGPDVDTVITVYRTSKTAKYWRTP